MAGGTENRLETAIRRACRMGSLSHALILSGEGDRPAAARFAAAAMECAVPEQAPCLGCNACRKVLADIHPDVTFVRDEEHKLISVDVLRAMRQDVYIRPNEGARKVYIFPDCGLLSEQGQNILLKVVEEGPSYAAFVFCAENASVLLPTVRSRCVELKLGAQREKTEPLPEAAALCRALARADFGEVLTLLVGMDVKKGWTREKLAALLSDCREILSGALLARYGAAPAPAPGDMRLTDQQLSALSDSAEHYAKECNYNVGVGHILGAVAAEWEEIL